MILTSISVVSILARTSSNCARPIVIAVLKAVLCGQNVNVLVISKNACVLWKGGPDVLIKAVALCPLVHKFPPFISDVIDSEQRQVFDLLLMFFAK